jgi:nucleoside-diphosphate-sugar epimerase
MRIAVTGGSGKAGQAALRELLDHGHEIANFDLAPPPTDLDTVYAAIDVTDFGQVMDAFSGLEGRRVLRGFDAVLHLAAIPTSGRAGNEVVFRTNALSTYNIFAAAAKLGIPRVVWASSETMLGLPFARSAPAYAPLDEEAPARPETSYALAKACGEELARQFARWHPAMAFLGLRLSNIMEPPDYAAFPGFQDDPRLRAWNLWGYVDARDTGQACRLALEAEIAGAETFVIAAADTVMERPSRALMEEVYPDTPFKRPVEGNETLLSIDKARAMLGYAPRHSWRESG